jgi:hypothetical protein
LPRVDAEIVGEGHERLDAAEGLAHLAELVHGSAIRSSIWGPPAVSVNDE